MPELYLCRGYVVVVDVVVVVVVSSSTLKLRGLLRMADLSTICVYATTHVTVTTSNIERTFFSRSHIRPSMLCRWFSNGVVSRLFAVVFDDTSLTSSPTPPPPSPISSTSLITITKTMIRRRRRRRLCGVAIVLTLCVHNVFIDFHSFHRSPVSPPPTSTLLLPAAFTSS